MTDPIATAFITEFEVLNERLRKAVDGLDAAALDRVLAPETNSLAVLVTHASGSELGWLHTAAGRALSRDRDAEFRAKGASAEDLRARVDRIGAAVPELVNAAVAAGLATTRRARGARGEREVSAGWALLHALDHLAEHVAHAELTRQLVTRS